MKSILTLIALFVFLNGNGQKDTARYLFVGGMRTYNIVQVDSVTSIYMDVKDSSVIIEGDTLRLIKGMMILAFKQSKELYEKQAELQRVIQAGVEFLNKLPDVYESKAGNCKWPPYWALLRKQGYWRGEVVSKPCK